MPKKSRFNAKVSVNIRKAKNSRREFLYITVEDQYENIIVQTELYLGVASKKQTAEKIAYSVCHLCRHLQKNKIVLCYQDEKLKDLLYSLLVSSPSEKVQDQLNYFEIIEFYKSTATKDLPATAFPQID